MSFTDIELIYSVVERANKCVLVARSKAHLHGEVRIPGVGLESEDPLCPYFTPKISGGLD
jgi:hypothetical protein